MCVDDKTRQKIITTVNNAKNDDFKIEELLARRSGSFMSSRRNGLMSSHTIVRICPPQNTSLDDIFETKDRIDNALRQLGGVCIFSVEMINPYSTHPQLLLGGGAGTQCSVETHHEEPVMTIIPESSNYDESIIPEEKKERDVEVVIENPYSSAQISCDKAENNTK